MSHEDLKEYFKKLDRGDPLGMFQNVLKKLTGREDKKKLIPRQIYWDRQSLTAKTKQKHDKGIDDIDFTSIESLTKAGFIK